MRIVMIAALCLGAAAPKGRLAKPGYLPTFAREQLDDRMQTHGIDLMHLTMSVVLLEYDDAQAAAQHIVEHRDLERPHGSDDRFNAALPSRFYDLQEQLHVRALTIADAAKRKNAPDMSAALSHLTETCIACHSVYLNGPEGPSSRATH